MSTDPQKGFTPSAARAEFFRLDVARKLDAGRRVEWGQFLTPPAVAHFMASLFQPPREHVRLLDAGAGVGALSAAFVAEVCRWQSPPADLSITAYEIDAIFADYLSDTLEACRVECERAGVNFTAEVRRQDFIEAAAGLIGSPPGSFHGGAYTHAILNPPYRKIGSGSDARHLLRSVGVETSNLYTAFLSLATRLLEPAGELVAITPRSFCNGPYFKAFRRAFLETMSFKRIHLFDARHLAFGDDDVLQENIIFHAVKQAGGGSVTISASSDPDDEAVTIREVTYEQLVQPDDADAFIRIVSDELDYEVAARMGQFTATLADLGLTVSTGRVVDFRATEHLRSEGADDAVPLIYPHHFCDGSVCHPKPHSKKSNWIADAPGSADLLVPSGVYVLVKRFSSKEEPRRVVAAIYDPKRTCAPRVGFENHLNYFHEAGKGMGVDLARGLAAFLNSSLLDAYFRQFNGHTQVNATDLRSLKYPSRSELEALGARASATSSTIKTRSTNSSPPNCCT